MLGLWQPVGCIRKQHIVLQPVGCIRRQHISVGSLQPAHVGSITMQHISVSL